MSKNKYMKKYLLLLFLILCSSFVIFLNAQDYNFPADNYRTAENRYYWKNRPPSAGYWQQDVHYKLIAKLNDSLDIIDGIETLDYYNNSPDTLRVAYFHLYSNAQNKDSYYSNLYKNNKQKLNFGKYESQDSGCYVKTIRVGNADLKTEVDNTVMKVTLPNPLPPNSSVTFNITFRTYFDPKGARNRMKMFIADAKNGFKQYDVVHWYPRICVYDVKFGWDVEQHMAHEFYGDFGTYDVAFTLPNNYVVGATGMLLNEEDVLPDTLLAKLDVRNFRDKPWGSPASVVIPRTRIPKTWLFHATNVHDFALTADPTYRIGLENWMGVQCMALAEETHASRWQNAASYTAKIIATDSKYFGMYGYPKIIVADARDGMEYPMLTLDGGGDPDYRTLLAHEVSHNWFFGMVGSNETYRAALDEGFTQFAESWICRKMDGQMEVQYPPKNGYVRQFYRPDLLVMQEVYSGYLMNSLMGIGDFTENYQAKLYAARAAGRIGYKNVTLNTASDDFSSALGHDGGYGQVYFKTATMLYNLQYVLGDSLFFKAMQHYFNKWKFAHPYLNDFRNSITEYVHADLTWFFDEWLNTAKTMDYGVGKIKKGKADGQYIITFKREGDMQMPIDFSVKSKKGIITNYYIPNGWFEKKTDAIILPRWIGWGKVQPTYTATVYAPGGISKVMIDTTHRLADLDMRDNGKPKPVKFYFDSKIANTPDWTNYEAFIGPSLWYNNYDGVQIGAHIHGDYMLFRENINATIYYNSRLGQYLPIGTPNSKSDLPVAFTFDYQTATDKFINNSSINLYLQDLDGLEEGKLLFQMKDNSLKNTFYAQLKGMYRPYAYDSLYELPGTLYQATTGDKVPTWEALKFNNTITVGMKHDYHYSNYGKGSYEFKFKSSAFTNDYDYNQSSFTWLNSQTIFKKLVLKTRVFAQYGAGDNTPNESALYLSGANPEEMADNPFTRAAGIIQPAWTDYGYSLNYFQEGGGLNIRGYSGYTFAALDSRNDHLFAYYGTSGASVNGELEFNHLIHFNPRFLRNTFAVTTYLFGDAGIINLTPNASENLPLEFSNIIADAGVGATLTIQKWGPLQLVKPLTLRFDMPFFLNKLEYNTGVSYFQYRFVVGIGRCF
jgi:hypothetical protein